MIRRLRLAETEHTIFETGPTFQEPDEVKATTRKWTSDVDKEILFLLFSMSENYRMLISKNSVHSLRDAWPELNKSCFVRGRLPPVLDTLLEYITIALNIVRQKPLQVGVTELSEDEKTVVRPNSQPSS